VLDNLLDNAIKYSPTTEPVQMAVTDTATGVRFEVSDRGIGVPPDDAEHIFEKFHRLDPEQTQSAGGTGLGLFIAKRLTHELGGNIGLAPNRARGTTFFVELPAS
jgi:two-component system OmpR family sensor kinase